MAFHFGPPLKEVCLLIIYKILLVWSYIGSDPYMMSQAQIAPWLRSKEYLHVHVLAKTFPMEYANYIHACEQTILVDKHQRDVP